MVSLGALAGVACQGSEIPITQRNGDDDDDDDDDTGSSSGESSSGEPGSSSGNGSSGGSSSSSGAPRTPGTLRIANFNVQNLLNDKDDSDAYQEEIHSTADYQAHLKEVAGALRTLDADVVVLVEVENQAVLDDLRATAELDGKYAHTAILPGNDPRGINIGLLSNVAVDKVVTHEGDRFSGELGNYTFSRDLPEYHLTFNGHSFVLLGVHFKAYSATGDIPRDNDKRLAEARKARSIADGLLAEDPARPVMFLGDFNADTGSPSTSAIRGENPEYDQVVDALPEGSRWTVFYGGDRMTYDDQWASPDLASIRDESSVELRQFSAVSDHKAVVCNYDFGE